MAEELVIANAIEESSEEEEKPCCELCAKTIDPELEEHFDTSDGIVCESCRTAHFAECDHCGELVRLENAEEIEPGTFICDDCISEYTECEHCSKKFRTDDMRELNEGGYVCDGCYDDVYFTCDNCGAVFHVDDGRSTDDGMVCDTCFDEEYFICEDCCETARRSDRCVTDDGREICESCRDNHYCCCDSCGGLFPEDEVSYHGRDDAYYCESCYQKTRHYILDHGDHPTLIYHRDAMPDGSLNPRMYGVEIETSHGGTEDENAEELCRIVGEDYLYAQEDGSLTDGIEFTTHPVGIAIFNGLNWERFCKRAVAMGYRAHDAGDCGIHVHITRSTLSEAAIINMVYVFEKFWKKLKKFSRRTDAQLADWANRYLGGRYEEDDNHPDRRGDDWDGVVRTQVDDYNTELFREIDGLVKRGYRNDRYFAVNLTNDKTIELRMFRGSLNPTTLKATVQFAAVLADVCCKHTFPEIKRMSWDDFISEFKNKYPELDAYLMKRGLYATEPAPITAPALLPFPAAAAEAIAEAAYVEDTITVTADAYGDYYITDRY